MAQKPNDRPQELSIETDETDPKIFVVVGDEKFPRPGLETFFAKTSTGPSDLQSSGEGTPSPRQVACSCEPVATTYCACNKVSQCSCVPVCTCEAVDSGCGCVAYTPKTASEPGSGSQAGSSSSTSSSYCSCNRVCSCVPVH